MIKTSRRSGWMILNTIEVSTKTVLKGFCDNAWFLERREIVCGRYHVDEEMAKEIERIIQLSDENVRKRASINIQMQARDLHPTEIAPVLTASDSGLECSLKRWGLPGFQKKQVIFNARSESALEKKSFKEGMEHRRIVIPAAWFYEWNRHKEKNMFYRKGKPVLFMAGIYNHYEDGDRFTILTTQANASMEPIHDRMPLVLEENEIIPWIFDRQKAREYLRKVPGMLDRKAEYEQLRLL